MNILLLGSGGREHAFAWKLSQSGNLGKLYIAPGNAGTAQCGENVLLNPLDFESVLAFCRDINIALVLPGNEDPLVAGIVDFIKPQSIAVVTYWKFTIKSHFAKNHSLRKKKSNCQSRYTSTQIN